MDHLKWELLDDKWFVCLIAEILAEKGLVIRHQGDGPDGGVDLFATQSISFGLDNQPFTWAVQCKFSFEPKKAVNTSDIKDVTGVLQSSRYQAVKPKGYMLFTNRPISHTIIERLRGINDQTEFRTCAIDGTRLTSLIIDNLPLLTKYFRKLPLQLDNATNASDTAAQKKEGEVKKLTDDLKENMEKVIMLCKTGYFYPPELFILRRDLGKWDREVEIALLRSQATTKEEEENRRDVESFLKDIGRVARERLEQMGVPIEEPK